MVSVWAIHFAGRARRMSRGCVAPNTGGGPVGLVCAQMCVGNLPTGREPTRHEASSPSCWEGVRTAYPCISARFVRVAGTDFIRPMPQRVPAAGGVAHP